MNFMNKVNDARAYRMQGGMYGAQRTPEQQAGAFQQARNDFSRASAGTADAYAREQRIAAIPTESPSVSEFTGGSPQQRFANGSGSQPSAPTGALRAADQFAGPAAQRDLGNGIVRYDNPGQSPLYSNVGNVDPGFGVSTVPAFQGARQQAAAQPQQRGGFLGGASGGIANPDAGRDAERNAMFERWGFENKVARADNPMAAASMMNKRLDSNNDLEGERLKANADMQRAMIQGQYGLQQEGVRGQYGLQQEGLRGQYGVAQQDSRNMGAMDVARLEGSNALDRANTEGSWRLYEREAANRGALDTAKVNAEQRNNAAVYKAIEGIRAQYASDPVRADLAIRQFLESQREQPVGYANGGLVGRPMYGQTPQARAVLPEVNEYREYAMGAKNLGLPPVPFEQFLAMRTGAKQVAGAQQQGGAMAFANGGEIPEPINVDGRMVVDPNPNAPTDSIPAVIDGQTPAKLDSGEFVIPADVVKFFGTAKLNKMIAEARRGEIDED